jgi:hypothetical protein
MKASEARTFRQILTGIGIALADDPDARQAVADAVAGQLRAYSYSVGATAIETIPGWIEDGAGRVVTATLPE